MKNIQNVLFHATIAIVKVIAITLVNMDVIVKKVTTEMPKEFAFPHLNVQVVSKLF